MSNDLAKLADKTLHDSKVALEEVLAHLKTASESVGDKAHDALEAASHAVTRAANALAEDARDKTKELAKKAGSEIKTHPLAATAVATAITAAAVGVAGLLVARHVDARDD